jgi:hypothetical protein
MSNYLQMPYQDIIGENSPVQKALKYLRVFADEKPMPNANTIQIGIGPNSDAPIGIVRWYWFD